MSKRTKSSRQWLAEHESDPYVKQARQAGYRSRAVFKLDEIQRADRLIRPGMIIVDLGAAPGGWSQLAAKLLQGRGRIVALDILPMDAIVGVEFLQGDFGELAFCDVVSGAQRTDDLPRARVANRDRARVQPLRLARGGARPELAAARLASREGCAPLLDDGDLHRRTVPRAAGSSG